MMCNNNCGQELFWDETKLSKKGKMIPLESDGRPHQCPNNPYKKKKQFIQGVDTSLNVTHTKDNEGKITGVVSYEPRKVYDLCGVCNNICIHHVMYDWCVKCNKQPSLIYVTGILTKTKEKKLIV